MIRPAVAGDAARILEIYAPFVLNTAVSFETEVPSLDEFRQRMKDYQAKFPWLVLEVDGTLAGYAYASTHRSRCAYEWSVESTIYVDPKFHGKRVGTRLYHELFSRLKAQGAVNVFAGIALPNEASVRLHESVGFTSIGLFRDIGFKLGQWWSVGWWQLQIQKPVRPTALRKPQVQGHEN